MVKVKTQTVRNGEHLSATGGLGSFRKFPASPKQKGSGRVAGSFVGGGTLRVEKVSTYVHRGSPVPDMAYNGSKSRRAVHGYSDAERSDSGK